MRRLKNWLQKSANTGEAVPEISGKLSTDAILVVGFLCGVELIKPAIVKMRYVDCCPVMGRGVLYATHNDDMNRVLSGISFDCFGESPFCNRSALLSNLRILAKQLGLTRAEYRSLMKRVPSLTMPERDASNDFEHSRQERLEYRRSHAADGEDED